jgi:hypothetical protein
LHIRITLPTIIDTRPLRVGAWAANKHRGADMSRKTITINGRIYDAHTGMPVGEAPAAEPAKARPPQPAPSLPRHSTHHSKDIHHATQKSQTLNRRVVKPTHVASSKKPSPQVVQRSSAISKFAQNAQTAPVHKPTMDIGPRPHHAVVRANQHLVAKKQAQAPAKSTPKPSQVIKNEAINKAMAQVPAKKAAEHKAPKKRLSRFTSIASASLALLLLGGYFTYINMPNLSVRVAAAQAGVNASYPEYKPDGYSLNGPIAYSDGRVSMKFAANAGPQNYTIQQSKSSWDSSAVLSNYVKEKAGENYITYNERGLTIYTFDGNAAWVNGGILYTIDGDAPLSGDQIRRIAISL